MKTKAQKVRERKRKHYHSAGFLLFTHRKPCVVGCTNRNMDAAHYRSRGAGGTWRDIFPACHAHHMEQERGIATFQKKHNVDLRAAADAHVAEWEALHDSAKADWEAEAEACGYRKF